MKQRINVVDDKGKHRIGSLDLDTNQVKTSDGKEEPLEHYKKNGVVKFFEKWKNGEEIK